MWKTQPPNSRVSTFLYAIDSAGKNRQDYALSALQGLYWFRVAGSGRFVAFTEQSTPEASERVRAVDLKSGKEFELFSFPTNPFKPPYLGIIGWLAEP